MTEYPKQPRYHLINSSSQIWGETTRKAMPMPYLLPKRNFSLSADLFWRFNKGLVKSVKSVWGWFGHSECNCKKVYSELTFVNKKRIDKMLKAKQRRFHTIKIFALNFVIVWKKERIGVSLNNVWLHFREMDDANVRVCSNEPSTVSYPGVMIVQRQGLPPVHIIIYWLNATLRRINFIAQGQVYHRFITLNWSEILLIRHNLSYGGWFLLAFDYFYCFLELLDHEIYSELWEWACTKLRLSLGNFCLLSTWRKIGQGGLLMWTETGVRPYTEEKLALG